MHGKDVPNDRDIASLLLSLDLSTLDFIGVKTPIYLESTIPGLKPGANHVFQQNISSQPSTILLPKKKNAHERSLLYTLYFVLLPFYFCLLPFAFCLFTFAL